MGQFLARLERLLAIGFDVVLQQNAIDAGDDESAQSDYVEISAREHIIGGLENG